VELRSRSILVTAEQRSWFDVADWTEYALILGLLLVLIEGIVHI
jgi:hypothetical protein